MNATQAYVKMQEAIRSHSFTRTVTDNTSPRQEAVYEAPMFSRFVLNEPCTNVPTIPLDRRWAIANVLHFFADTDRAAPLLGYNEKQARRFIAMNGFGEWLWEGAYGYYAMDKVRECVKLLLADRMTRRAIVSMGNDCDYRSVNLPHCWNLLQFLSDGDALHVGVSQRSLSMRVYPYDLVVLSNVLRYVAMKTNHNIGSLTWTIGSLHADDPRTAGYYDQTSIQLPLEVMSDPKLAWSWLEDEDLWTIR